MNVRGFSLNPVKVSFTVILVLNIFIQILLFSSINQSAQVTAHTKEIQSILEKQRNLVLSYKKMIYLGIVGLEYKNWDILIKQRSFAKDTDKKMNESFAELKAMQYVDNAQLQAARTQYIKEIQSLWHEISSTSLDILRSNSKESRSGKLLEEWEKRLDDVNKTIEAQINFYKTFRDSDSRLRDLFKEYGPLLGVFLSLLVFFLVFVLVLNPLERQTIDFQTLIRIMSHDIVNPLSIINGSTNLIEKKHGPTKQTQSIIKASSSIKDIIEHVRQFQVIADGKQKFNLAPVDLLQVLEKVNFLFADKLAEKSIKLIIKIKESNNLKFLAEKNSFCYEVLSNIISNAIKFSSEKSKIIISATKEDNEVIIKIKDFGVGIAGKDIKSLFSFHKHTTKMGTQGESGSGYGLPLAKLYMNKYKGQITVESQSNPKPGELPGTTFILSLQACH